MSDLLNIKNTSGDETYTQDGNKFVWNANKNDIYYQGESEKELPIECEVMYNKIWIRWKRSFCKWNCRKKWKSKNNFTI